MRSRINIYNHNKKVNNRIKNRESIIKEKYGNITEEELAKELNKSIAMQHILDNEFKKKYIEFNKDTVILGSKYTESKPEKYAPINGIKQEYSDIKPFFTMVNDIRNHTRKVQTGQELIQNVVEIDQSINYSKVNTKANMSIPSLNKAYENFKNQEEFFVFDTETLSGMGRTGYNELDSLQEIAFRKFRKNNGNIEEIVEDRVETLIGITQEQYDEYYDIFVKNFDNKGWEGVQKYEVIANRFAKLGHQDTTIKNAGKGLAITETFASDESENLMDISNIKRGLDRALEIGKRQNKERLSNGLMVWEDQLLRSVNIFKDNFVAGYNSTNFDFEKMNQSIAKVWSNLNDTQKDEYSKILGLSKGMVPTITTSEGNYLDFRDVVRTAAEFVGKVGIYENDDEKLKAIKDIGKTLLQQESLGEVFAKNAMFTAAHTAGADVTTLAHLMAGNELNGVSLFDKLMTTINDNASSISTPVDYNSILMATQGEFFNDFTRKGALNFTTDRATGAIRTFNGFSLDANGDVRDLGKYGKATGIKKNVAYRIGFMGEMDMSEEWVEKMSGIHQDYAQGKLWTLTLNPIIDKEIAGNNNILGDPTTYMFTSREAMEGFVSSHFANIGNVGADGKFYEHADKAAREAVRKEYSTVTIKDGQIIANKLDNEENFLKNVVEMATEQAMNDPAARMVRENEYTKAVKFQKMQDYLVKNGAATIDEQKKMLSLATAESVAGGQVQKIQHNVLSILGYHDTESKKQVLHSSTLNNTINSYEYMASKRNVIDAVVNAVNEYGDIDSEQKQFIYDTIMRNLRDDIAREVSIDDIDKEKIINDASELKVYAKDLDYFEFDMPENYFKHTNAKSMPDEIDNVLRVNLKSEKEYSLVNDLLRRRRGNDDRLKSPNARQAYGMEELKKFAQEVNSMEEYKGIFDDILYGKPVNELKNLANIKKYEKNLLKDEMYGRFEEIIKSHVDNDKNVSEAMSTINWLKQMRDMTRKTIAESAEARGSYTKTLQALSDEFKATIVPDAEWASYSKERREAVKSRQSRIMQEQQEIIDLFSNDTLYEQLHELEDNIDSEYKKLFSVLDSSKKDAKENFKKNFKNIMSEKESEIAELYRKLDESVENIPINSDISVDAMSERMIQAIKKYRESNPTAGFSKDRVRQNVLSSDVLLSGVDDELVAKSIAKTKENLSDLKLINTSDKNSVKAYVEDLVDNVLMPTVKDSNGNTIKGIDEIVEFAQKTYGYNDETAKLFKYNLEFHREEHIKGMSNLVESVTKHGGLVSYNPNKSQMGLVINGETYNLWGMPKTKFENGVLFHQTGSNRVGAGIKLDAQDALNGTKFDKNKISIRSNLSDAYRELRFLDYNINRAVSRGEDPGKAIIRNVGKAAEKVRELSALGKMTTKDSYAWQGFDMSEAILSMPHVLDELKAYDGWQDKDFIDIIEKNKKRIIRGNVSSEVKEAFAKNKQDVAKVLLGMGAGVENKKRNAQEFILSQISNYTKDGKLSEGKTMLGEYSPMALTEFDNPSRPPISSADEILYNKKQLSKAIKENGLEGLVELDPRLISKRQRNARHFDGVGEIVSGVTFKNASISEKKFKEIVNEHFKNKIDKGLSKEDKVWYEKLQKQMSSLNLTEQGKILDGKVANIMLSATETQRINTFKNFSRDIDNNTEIMQKRIRNAMPTIEIAKSGEIVFQLGKKEYVKRGDALFAIDGYGDVLDTIGVKEDAGLFGFGYNSKGSNLAVDQDTISEFLNQNKDKILNSDGTVNQSKAMALLDETYDSGFYVKNAFIKGYNKGTIEYAEKGMYEALLSGAGTLDDNISKLLKAVNMTEADGRILGDDFIELLEEKYSGLTKEQKEAIGFANGWEEVKKAINKEKYAKTDLIREIDKFNGVVAFSNDNIIKHGNAGIAMKGFINNIAEQYRHDDPTLSLSEAMEKTYNTIKEAGIFNGMDISFNNGKIEFGEIKDPLKAEIDIDAVKKLSEKLGLYDASSPFAIKDNEGNVVGYTTTLSTVFNEDFSGTSRSSIERDKIKKNLDDTRKQLRALDPNKDSASYKALQDKVLNLEHEYNAAKKYDKTMTISSREMDMMSLYEYDENKMAKLKEKFDSKNLSDDYNKIFNRMLDNNGALNDEYIGRGIHQGFLDDIYERGYEQAVEKKQYFDSAKDAVLFNNDPVGGTEFLEKNKFEKTKIEDLVIPTGHDTTFLQDDPNRSFGRNLLIDTGLSGKDKYIAISASDYTITGDDINTDDVQKALSKLQHAKNRLNDGMKGINGALDGNTTIKDLEARVKSAAEEVKDSMVDSMKKTVKGLSSVQLGGYAYDKASMVMPDYHMYNVSEINGKTLKEWADSGVHYDASWHGKQYFKDLGYFDEAVWKDKYGMKSEDEMIEYLSKHGTAGIELRTPTIKEGSMSMTRKYLDPSMLAGQVKTTAVTVYSRNQDHDGDSLIQAELRHKETGMTLVDYEIAKQRGQVVPESAEKYFEEFNAAQTYRASTVNEKVFNAVAVPTYEKDVTGAIDNVNANKVLDSAKVNYNGKFATPFSQVETDTALRDSYLKKYGEIENSLIEKLGKEKYNSLEQLDRAKEIDKHIASLADNLQDDYRNAARFVEIYEKDMAAVMAKTAGKASIGYINTPLATMRRAAAVEGFTGEQRQYLQAAADILEQNIISKKHSTDYTISLAQTFRTHLNDMFAGKQSGVEGVNSLIRENYSDAMVEKLKIYSDIDFTNVSDDEILNRVTSAISDLGIAARENKNFKNIIDAENFSNTLSGSNVKALTGGMQEGSTGANKFLARANYNEGASYTKKISVDMDGFSPSTVRNVVSSAGEIAEDVIKSFSGGSGLAKAALGIAGAIMATGYIGGNPTIAPGTEAQELDNYDSLQDQDLSIQQLPQGAGQGYVININAQSPKGQEHAVQAIQKAMRSSVPTDINIAMSMNDNTKRIDSAYIEKLLSGAI